MSGGLGCHSLSQILTELQITQESFLYISIMLGVWLELGPPAKSRHFSPPQANCIDSTASAEAVFASEVKKMQQENMKPQEQLTLEPYERDHAVVVGVYR